MSAAASGMEKARGQATATATAAIAGRPKYYSVLRARARCRVVCRVSVCRVVVCC